MWNQPYIILHIILDILISKNYTNDTKCRDDQMVINHLQKTEDFTNVVSSAFKRTVGNLPLYRAVKAYSVMLMKRSIISDANYPWCRKSVRSKLECLTRRHRDFAVLRPNSRASLFISLSLSFYFFFARFLFLASSFLHARSHMG